LWPITNLVQDLKITEALSSPTMMSFGLDPDNRRIRGLHTDGRPYLEYIRRTVKYFRWERVAAEARERFVHRYTGYVWPINDDGDDDTQFSTVTCFDPLHIMSFRFARAADLAFDKVPFTTTAVGDILRTLIDRTNSISPTGLTTAGGVNEVTPTASVEWHTKMISEAMSEMTARADIAVAPLDSENGQHGRLDVYAKRGQHRGDLRLAWNAPPHTAETFSRISDPSDACTTLVGIGSSESGNQLVTVATDEDAAENWLLLEAVQTYSDVRDQSHLDALVARDFVERRPPQDGITISPVGSIEPWTHFETGDTCRVAAGVSLRGGVPERVERILGFTYSIDDDDVASTTVVTSEDQ
jgi:hypothetical protein